MATYPNHVPVTLPDIDALPDSALLRLPSIIALCQCSRSSWFAWVRAGHAPQPVRIGPKAVAWKAGEVRAFMRGQPRGDAPAHTVAGGKAGRAKQLAAKAAEAAKAAALL
ncbi:helix-turn-helix transcriptional regulator [Pseudomonas sp. NPDC090755]|uniref:helix-turn-helix transcriptional regulator n=1 Tax=Pseudomonas sp. NPDC090755 TaxID=3364481 RepID=UPI00383B0B9B